MFVSEYSFKFKALADQIPDLVPPATRDLEFVARLSPEIKKFIVSQTSVAKENWTDLVGHTCALKRRYRLVITVPLPQPTASIVPLPPLAPDRSASAHPALAGDSSPNQSFRSTRPGYSEAELSVVNFSSPKLEISSDSDRTFLIKHKGIFSLSPNLC